jgi:hypothetical protein
MQMLISGPPTPAPCSAHGRVETVTITANRTVPQPPGTAITWTAIPSGEASACEYKWLVHNGSSWEVATNWSESDTFTWTPAFANPRYRVAVWVRTAGSTRDEIEASTEAAFAIDGASTQLVAADAPPRASLDRALVLPLSTVTLHVNLPSPQPVGTVITWTAFATGGGTGRQFKWFVYDGTTWRTAAPWSTNDTFEWTPLEASPRHRIAVWARSAGNTRDYFEASADAGFAVIPCAQRQ